MSLPDTEVALYALEQCPRGASIRELADLLRWENRRAKRAVDNLRKRRAIKVLQPSKRPAEFAAPSPAVYGCLTAEERAADMPELNPPEPFADKVRRQLGEPSVGTRWLMGRGLA